MDQMISVVSTTRFCGTCTMCCKTHEVEELGKGAAKACQFCVKGRGCTIYSKRPKGCRDFLCDWRKGHGNEQDRPDHTGVVLDSYLIPEFGFNVYLIWEGREGALEKPFAKRRGRAAMSEGFAVALMRLSGSHTLYFPDDFTLSSDIRQTVEAEGTKLSRRSEFPA